MSILGTRVVRNEDPRLLTAGGTYVEDLRVPELARAARVTFVRSPLAHAMITGLDLAAARGAPGVLAVLTARDMDDLPAPPPGDGTGPEGSEAAPVPLGGPWTEPLLAADRVRYVGDRWRWCSPTAATRARTPPNWSAWTTSPSDYAMISAAELPSFELLPSETPTDINPLGAKGIGEAGTIGAAPATQNAVIDAVSHLSVRHIDMPATPARVWAAISAARQAR